MFDRSLPALLGITALCACHLRNPAMDSIRGSTPLVIENSSGKAICELTVQRYMSGIRPADVSKPGEPWPVGSRVTWSVGTFDLDVIAHSCSTSYKDLMNGEIERLKLTGPTVLAIGGPITDAPPGYAVVVMPLTNAPTPTDMRNVQTTPASSSDGGGESPAAPTEEPSDCLPDGSSTRDTSKCCSATYHSSNGVSICG